MPGGARLWLCAAVLGCLAAAKPLRRGKRGRGYMAKGERRVGGCSALLSAGRAEKQNSPYTVSPQWLRSSLGARDTCSAFRCSRRNFMN